MTTQLPTPEFALGASVVVKDSGKARDTLLSGTVTEITFSQPRKSVSPPRIRYSVCLELGLVLTCEAQDLYLDRR